MSIPCGTAEAHLSASYGYLLLTSPVQHYDPSYKEHVSRMQSQQTVNTPPRSVPLKLYR